MDIKSVIKTFAEAWAAASLKMEQRSNSNFSMSHVPQQSWRAPSMSFGEQLDTISNQDTF